MRDIFMGGGVYLHTNSEVLNLIIAIFIWSWIFSVAYGLIITLSYPIFTKTGRGASGAIVPIYNLFGLCEIVGYSCWAALLFLLPGINLIMSMVVSYKLKDVFNTKGFFNFGLIFLAALFVPVLAHGNREAYDSSYENERMEPQTMYPQEEPQDIDVDSIFKTPAQMQQMDNSPYKAKKVQVNEKFINSAPAEPDRVEKFDR